MGATVSDFWLTDGAFAVFMCNSEHASEFGLVAYWFWIFRLFTSYLGL